MSAKDDGIDGDVLDMDDIIPPDDGAYCCDSCGRVVMGEAVFVDEVGLRCGGCLDLSIAGVMH